MNILISAYACEPNRGSEPGVGWGWAVEMAKHHSVWVITRDNNKKVIEEYQALYPEYNMDSLHFVYVGVSKKLTFWKKGNRGIRLYYKLWQHKAAKRAKKLHEKVHFDLIHHVTFVSYTQPTYMYKLGVPLVWGPVAGGENIPNIIKIDMSAKERLIEKIRRLSQMVALLEPSIKNTMKKSKRILVATEETFEKIPKKYHEKTSVMQTIGLERIPKIEFKEKEDDKIRIIMAGRLIYWKAFDIGLKAYLKIADKYPQTELYILGEGNKKNDLIEIAGEYLNKQVFFEEPVSHDDIYEFFSKFDIFLNTTLRDSGCMTMMEAIAAGVQCIAVATGGPKVLGKDGNAILIDPKEVETLDEVLEEMILKIANKNIGDRINHPELLYSSLYENLKKELELSGVKL